MSLPSSCESAVFNFVAFFFFQVASYLRPRHEQPGQHPEGEERAGRGRAAALQSRFYSVRFFKTLTKNLRH